MMSPSTSSRILWPRLPVLFISLTSLASCSLVLPPASLPSAPYAAWAHSHFVWLSNGDGNAANVTSYVSSYAAHNISVGAVDIDSGWSSGYNNFIVDESKFPNLTSFVSAMHSEGVNVILWATAMIDTDSSNFNTAMNNSYVIRNGFNASAIVTWWHGDGAFLDYFNPAAKAWWEGQLDGVLESGIDGWKVDGTDPYLIELITPYAWPYAAPITLAAYQNETYGHFFNYTRSRNGAHTLIWSRPVDSYPVVLNISAFLTFSPKYVMWAGWVGDQDPDFTGMKMALINILESAWQNYTNFASDTGGYRGGSRTGELLIRWAQLNAFLPLFENGGDNEHRPWFYESSPGSTLITDTYRALVASHYELVPYLLSSATTAYAAGVSVISPTLAPPVDFPFILEPDMVSDYSYTLGPNMFVSPIPQANVTAWNVTMPTGSDAWSEYYNPAAVHPGGENFMYATPLNVTPVFVRNGAVLPLHVSTPLGLVRNGDESWATALTLLVHTPSPAGGSVNVHLHEEGGIIGAYSVDAAEGSMMLTATAHARDIIFLLRGVRVDASTTITLDACTSTGALQQGRVLPRLEYPPASTATPLALDWESTSAAPRLPIQGRSQRIRDAADAAGVGWSAADAGSSASGMDEIIVRAGSAACGVRVRIVNK